MIVLPWPPTVNHYYTVARGRKVLSTRGRSYKAECCLIMAAGGTERLVFPHYQVCINAYPPDNRCRDLDNILKPALDALTEYGAITDDHRIDDLRIQRFNKCSPGRIEIRISGCDTL